MSRVDFRFDVIRWNFSNLSACFRLWLCLFICTCTVVYYSFHFWAYTRLSLIPKAGSTAKSTGLCKKTKVALQYSLVFVVLFDLICLIAYCCYVGLFTYVPVHCIVSENYPIATRIIILIEQVRRTMSAQKQALRGDRLFPSSSRFDS